MREEEPRAEPLGRKRVAGLVTDCAHAGFVEHAMNLAALARIFGLLECESDLTTVAVSVPMLLDASIDLRPHRP